LLHDVREIQKKKRAYIGGAFLPLGLGVRGVNLRELTPPFYFIKSSLGCSPTNSIALIRAG
jgi:hypothetical protein